MIKRETIKNENNTLNDNGNEKLNNEMVENGMMGVQEYDCE